MNMQMNRMVNAHTRGKMCLYNHASFASNFPDSPGRMHGRNVHREVVEHEAEGERIQWDLKLDQQLQHNYAHQDKEYAEARERHVSIDCFGVLQ